MAEPFWRRYRRFFHPDVDRDVDEELRYHLERLTEDELARGGDLRQARARAAERFGDLSAIRRILHKTGARRLKRSVRAEAVDALVQDLRYAVRRIRHEPGLAAAVVAILALGIGATTAMFSAVDAALLRSLPFRRPDRLVALRDVNIPFQLEMNERADESRTVDLLDVLDLTQVFAHAGGYAAGGVNLSDPERPLRVNAGIVTAGFFPTLGVQPVEGRTFAAEEGVPGGTRVVVLSHRLWRRHFGEGAVIGSRITLNARSYLVIGVMPAGFNFPSESDVWIPMTVPTTFETFEPFRGWLPSRVVARLRDGVTHQSANALLLTRWEQVTSPPGRTLDRWLRERLEDIRRTGAMRAFHEDLAGNQRTALVVLLGATGLLLLIACANVTHLLLSRAATRRREIAMRGVLGATHGRLVRQLLTESALLALAGAGVGLLLAPLALRLTQRLTPPALAGLAPPAIDLRVLVFALVLTVLSAITFGLWPAFAGAGTDAGETLKSGGWGTTSGAAGRARRVLVATELALTLMLLVGAGLMLKSFQRLVTTRSGLQPERVATLELTFARASGPRSARLAILDAALERLTTTPGIDAAGAVNDLPLRGSAGISVTFEVEGRPQPVDQEPFYARLLKATGGYFAAVGVPLLQGRVFTPADDSLAPGVVLVSATMARELWPGGPALGRTIRFAGDSVWHRVIGVVGDVREGGLERELEPQVYFPLHSETPDNVALTARGTLQRSAMLDALRQAVRTADPTQAVYNVRMMEDVISAHLATPRTYTALITVLGALALILAAFGVYGVVAYNLTQRTRELGIRAALGATAPRLLSMIASEMVGVGLVAVTLGVAAAWAAARVLESMVYDITVRDVPTYAIAMVVLLTTLAIATLWPARRALRLNPMDVIRVD